ncbi:hypothetical protein [Alteribacter lacisalsi]|uniref:hypothetical protein n=1 Tax=Alteribacter lacisalsi TaxID=2045244 RepID=UPI002E264A52
MDALLELAITLKNPLSTEPLYPMTVVRGGKENREQNIARAEKMLGHAVVYAAAVDVPVRPLTRAGGNTAKRIGYAMTDNRISMVVAGWDGDPGERGRVFGHVLDDVIESTDRQVLVSKLSHPLNLTKRLVVVIPKAFDHMKGADEAFRTIKKLASRTSAELLLISVGESSERYVQILDQIKPSLSAEAVDVEDWSDLKGRFYDKFYETDLLVILSARKGTVSWHYRLERLPVYIKETRIVSFIVLFPEEGEVDDRGTKATVVSRRN